MRERIPEKEEQKKDKFWKRTERKTHHMIAFIKTQGKSKNKTSFNTRQALVRTTEKDASWTRLLAHLGI